MCRHAQGSLPKHQQNQDMDAGRIPWWVPEKVETALYFLNFELGIQQLPKSPSQWTLSHWSWTFQEKITISLVGPCTLKDAWEYALLSPQDYKHNEQMDSAPSVSTSEQILWHFHEMGGTESSSMFHFSEEFWFKWFL